MKLSHEKVTHVSHVLAKALAGAPGVRFAADRNDVRLKIVDLLRAELRRDEEIERRVRTKIVSQKRAIPEGSQEWDVLFRKYYEEELGKIRGVRG
ncbi:MAG TPA: DUF507 family protein [Candidatus Polarisedimenticolia bacterium]|nr:DUF507 family protein [Candidatus Polarisedimenticolia bacterium]